MLTLDDPATDPATDALYRAIREGSLDDTRKAIKAGADVNARLTRYQQTPLHLAAIFGQTAIAGLLIKKGANVNATDVTPWTQLQEAMEKGHPDVVKLLTKHGADLSVSDGSGLTPLHLAARDGLTDLVRLFIDAGAPISPRDVTKRTPLQLAATFGHPEIVAMLDNAALEDAAKGHARRVGTRRSAGDGKEASR
jgi:ankyrin repeat protein